MLILFPAKKQEKMLVLKKVLRYFIKNMDNAQKISILSVDDDPDILVLVEYTLDQAGYHVRTALGPSLALEELQKGLPDLILLDVMMPEKDGFSFCAELKANEHYAKVPVIFLSALDSEQNMQQALSVGGVDFLTKPASREILVAAIEKHLKQQAK